MKQFLLLDSALSAAGEIADAIKLLPGVAQAEIAGSIRRRKDIVGDIDIVVAAEDPQRVASSVAEIGVIRHPVITPAGHLRATTWHGMEVKIWFGQSDAFGALLQNRTGSLAHNHRLAELAKSCGLDAGSEGISVTGDNEVIVYGALGLVVPQPHLRENRGEIEAAASGSLPELVQISDLRGELHSHTLYSDGVSSVDQMADAALERGYEYWAVTDHSLRPGLMQLSRDDHFAQATEIQSANRRLGGLLTVLHGIEVNIGADGSLDYPEALLDELDIVVASIHDRWGGGVDTTSRLLRAIENPRVNIIGHPTSRFIGRLPGADFDAEKVFTAAAALGVAMEVNAHPERLDLCGEHVMLARSLGCRITVNCDAHGRADLQRMELGIATAQRGWAIPDDVINCWPLDRLREFLSR